METRVNVMLPDGTIKKDAYVFFNDYTQQYNMLTLWMLLNNLSSSIMEDRIRAMHTDKVLEVKHSYMFWVDDTCYITLKSKSKKH